MDEVRSLLSDRAVLLYFLVLGLAIRRCVKQYYGNNSPKDVQCKQQSPQSAKISVIPILFSVLIVFVTWYLIIRFILTNLHTSESYFDDAYKDVLRTPGHYFTSTQLLTWAIVAVVWTADAGADLAFLLFGFLGAMSASFVLWVPTLYRRQNDVKGVSKRSRAGVRRRSVPVAYVLSSIIAFVSILKLRPCDKTVDNEEQQECTPDQGFGSFQLHFCQWLQVLHIILVVPVFVSRIWPNMPRIDSTVLFGLLTIVISGWHISQVASGAEFTMPSTDCQWSITTDLVCCSVITLYAVYMDSCSLQKTTKNADDSSTALVRLSMAALALPLLSPAAVLAGHLCWNRLHDSHAALVAYLQRMVASKLRAKDSAAGHWCNLGLWTEKKDATLCSYDEACKNLARALGEAANLGPFDAVLSCGCGSLDEVRYFKKQFDLRHITGIDPHLKEARSTDEDDFNVRTIRASVEDLASVDDGDQSSSLFPRRYFDKILSLDNIYHYPCKESFLLDCLAMLPGRGSVAFTDIVLKKDISAAPIWVKVVLRLMGVQSSSLWSCKTYAEKLTSFGYSGIEIKEGVDVFKGWGLLPEALLKYIDFAIIVAKKDPYRGKSHGKKKVAIIGSGLAGLSTAHYLLSSSAAADVTVDIYEANNCPGLAGNTTLIGEQLVDVPARMAALGYYNRYREILEELDIPSTVVRTDCSFYGSDGLGGQVCHCYDQNSCVNMYNAIFVGGLRRLWQLIVALSNLCDDHGSIQAAGSAPSTFGDWLQKNLSVSQETTFTCKESGVNKKHDLPSLTCYENPFAYVMVGSLSWMLSCTWEQLSKYPADIVLPYCRGLNMSRLGMGRKGQVIRVTPSIKVLERALLYGVNKLQCGSRVAAIDGMKKVINGVSYDAIICAAEARAVPKIIKNCSDVFGKIAYHPSTIYLHKDESFMPPDKKDWKCWNVEMSSGRKEPQLTFWLNAFYPDSNFDTNVFQTWAPTHTPKPKLTIRRSDFERVVHTQDTKTFVSEIEKEQGKDGIYFAGSYVIYGMGLLEQALISGKSAADKVLQDFVHCSDIEVCGIGSKESDYSFCGNSDDDD